MNNFSTVPCTTVGSVEIGQAWLSSHFLFSLMESLFSSMSPSLLRDVLFHGYNWDSPEQTQVGKELLRSSGSMIGATSRIYGHSPAGEILRSKKL